MTGTQSLCQKARAVSVKRDVRGRGVPQELPIDCRLPVDPES